MSGRRVSDPAKTREQILDAALSCFSEHGFAATSIRDVAEAAKVPKSLVLYHYESKEALWLAAIQREARPLIEFMIRYSEGDADLSLRDLLRTRFELLRRNPNLSRLLAWLSLESAPMPPLIQELAPAVMGRVRSQLVEIRGTEDEELDMLPIVLLGAMDGWFRYRRLYSSVAGFSLEDPDADERFLSCLSSLIPQGKEEGK